MASSSRNNKQYDVFVSFRGEETRDNFTSHLYSALCRQNIQTFIDDQLNRGDEISESLVNAIEASAISVIVFSEGYASSRWCLDELVKILECKKEYAQIVIPVFYRVDPSDVRNQTGSFGDSFSKLEERFKENSKKLLTWRNALKEAATLSGFNSLNIRPESELINEAVNHISKRLLDQVFRPNDNKNQLVGVESRVEEIESLLGVQSKDVYALGIWGIGGIGKTTVARATFDKISRYFEGEDVDLVMKFFNASGFYPEIGMSVLVDKSLIAIDSHKKITIHDLLQELGREIVRQESIDPGNRSRLWHHEDIYEVLTYNTGTKKIEGICLDMSTVKEIRLNLSTFTKMPKLRFLKFYSSSFNGENKCKVSYLQDPRFAEVKYFHWHGYPLKSLPSNLSAEKLVFLKVPYSDIEQLWNGEKHYSNLNQIINATCNKLIAKTPNPTLMPHLNKLVILNLRGSKSLKSLPSGIFNLEFLTKLDLSGCSKLKRLLEISSGNINWLFLRETAIEELPSSIERLLRLGHLDLSDCKRLKSLPSSLFKLKSLGVLNLGGCSNLQRLPECLGQLSSPIILNLAKTNVERIPESIIQLFVLRYLLLSYSERIQSVSLPLARGFLALQSFLGILEDTQRSPHMDHKLAVRWQEVQENRGFSMGKVHMVRPGNEIPKWFKFQSARSFVTLEMPPDFFRNSRLQGIAFSAILAFSNRHVDCGRWFSFSFELKVKTTKDCGPHDTELFQSRVNYIESDHLHLGYYLFCEEDFKGFWNCNCIPEAVQFNVFPSLECECCGVKKCGIDLFRFPNSASPMEDPSTCFNYNEEG
ncbi:ADP-ribosyl cyclase/cyclic ADP-ribose hydrolase [Citrus sinensis]|uniref:ADP-ribosyl cyclase/cyclic ADP-ribose hydrolase n=1 Tax=Citrus sinensis TaxID=2711 RepID=A0ACB8M891_CITSI|nr:ADP-ribosyl cyclase/cyclic ADP-ribose hydrolase [Citrus sinensis]